VTEGLAVAKTLTLPLKAVTGKHALLGSSGAGKSNAGVVLAEAMYDAGLIFVAIDPKGDWWGLRYGANTRTPGLEIPIFGGLHSDDGLELHPESGSFIASLIVERRLRCVLDLSEMTKGEQTRFLADFAERLFRLKNSERFPLHLFLDEVDEYLPQKVIKSEGNAARCLGVWSRIVKQGRNRGIGITLMSQRSAVVNKDVLTQTETLIALRTTAPQDRAAIRAWVEHHALGRDLVNALPELENGEAWVWSPHAYKLMANIQFARRRTFDSGATPELGEELEPPGRLADVDIAVIKEQMAETVEKATANDPKTLKRKIADLERQLAERPAAEPQVLEVEVPFIPRDVLKAITTIGTAGDQLMSEIAVLNLAIADAAVALADRPGGANQRSAPPVKAPAAAPAAAPAPRPARTPAGPSDASLSGPQRKLLTVLAVYGPRTKRQLAMQAGYSAKGGGFNNPLSSLRTLGYISPKGVEPIVIFDAGLDALGEYDPLPTGQALIDHWMGLLSGPEKKILLPVIKAHPATLTKDELADAAGYDPAGGGFNNPLSRLRSLELVTKGTPIGLTDDFAEAIG
jgi:hypothetical protein